MNISRKNTTSLLVLGLLILLCVYFLIQMSFIFKPIVAILSIVFPPIIIAAIFYYLIHPIIDKLDNFNISRKVSILVFFGTMLLLFIIGAILIFPIIADKFSDLAITLPSEFKEWTNSVGKYMAENNLGQFRTELGLLSNYLSSEILNFSQKSFSFLFLFSKSAASVTSTIFITIIISPIVLYYLLKDHEKLLPLLKSPFPKKWNKHIEFILISINTQLENYVRGQVLVALIVMFLLLIGLPIIGLKYSIIIAIFSGIMNLIPFLGFYLAIIPALLISFITGGIPMLIKVVIIYALEQLIEGRFVTPLVLGKQLNIHPLTVMFVLLASGKVAGILGVIFAIPLYTISKVILIYLFSYFKEVLPSTE